MADFSKRPEITVETMGKVHNPTGAGVPAVSSQAQAKAAKVKKAEDTNGVKNGTSTPAVNGTNGSNGSDKSNGSKTVVNNNKHHAHHHSKGNLPETKIKGDAGSARRNIVRRKAVEDGIRYDNRNKKQGGAGKGKWGSEIDGTEDQVADDGAPLVVDENDPLYDEHEDAKYILTTESSEVNARQQRPSYYEHGAAVYGPMVTLPEFKRRVAEIVLEYFDSSDTDEVIRGLEELHSREHHREVIKKVISISLDKGPRERELTSKLLTCLHPTPLSENDVEEGFAALLQSLHDLEIDIPDAKEMVGSFLARAVVDEVLPPAFLTDWNNDNPGDEVVERAVGLLSREHCTARLERIWGPGDGRPVAELKTVMDQLLKEYLLSRELDEAARCVRELSANHFHHELVKRGVKIAMEEDGNSGTTNGSGQNDTTTNSTSAIDAMAALLCFLLDNAIVSEYQVIKGIRRLYKLLPDLKLDVPAAPTMLEEFVELIREGGVSIGAVDEVDG